MKTRILIGSMTAFILCSFIGIYFYSVDSNKKTSASKATYKNFQYSDNWIDDFMMELKYYKSGINIKNSYPVKIAILDTMVSKKNRNEKIVYKGTYEKNHNGVEVSKDISHGQNILYLLEKYGPNDTNIYYASVASPTGDVHLQSLEESLEWAINNEVDFINLSFTLVNESTKLNSLLKEAYDKGIMIFASAGNDGDSILSYPSSSPYVYAVGGLNKYLQRAYYSNYTISTSLYFMPSDDVQLIDNKDMGTSYSSILLTAYMASIFTQKQDDKERLLKKLFNDSNSNFYFPKLINETRGAEQ